MMLLMSINILGLWRLHYKDLPLGTLSLAKSCTIVKIRFKSCFTPFILIVFEFYLFILIL